ncbi:DeoR/GlpR family DNA-binding transcription regulator [Umezawaea sp. Da 62-37]|uniref:DeoR/GlpR family DNA-binding transcription regulator n=1 Tax=Umezawaea sp. Da 62-37 TaxID=3075927 RepID=UPI0028F6C180|nr:DeoR/GlpR family DNA-binding transcription regulator [Umezawaea sp. Da 62-37]WNV86006.1 DeoR/GlpR family DNA-binding transcription regulator [Umezawaea sp. Da 62-37]
MPKEQPVFAEERRQRIADAVAAQGRVRLAELVEALGVTEPTIRKDLDELQRRQLLRRTHGGAIAYHQHIEVNFHDRGLRNRQAKELIARACREEIAQGESVFLDSGTTVEEIANGLDHLDVNVLTNALGVANLVADQPGVRHTLIGGQIRSLGGSLVGPVALDNLMRFTVDVAFVGASGLTGDGISVADVSEAQIKRTVIDRARRVVVPMDSSKFGTSDFVTVCSLDQVDLIVTERATEDVTRWCQEHDVDLHVAKA